MNLENGDILAIVIMWGFLLASAIYVFYMRRKGGGKILPTKEELGPIIMVIILIFAMFFIVIFKELLGVNAGISENSLTGIFLGFIIFLSAFSMIINDYRKSKEQYKGRAFIISIFAALIGIIGLALSISMINLISCYLAYLIIKKYSKKIGVSILIGTVLCYFFSVILSIYFWTLDIVTFLSKPDFSLSIILIFVPVVLELIKRFYKKKSFQNQP